jgi:structure-specific endonuclease subunit SLX1
MSNIHLLTGVPSFEKWPLNLHFFHKDARAAWDHWLRSTARAARASLKIHEDFTQSTAGSSAGPVNGIHGLPLDYSPIKEYVQKANDVVSFEQEGDCVHCKEKLDSGKGLHAMCPNSECVAMGHLDCWSRYALGSSNDGSIIPENCSCPACDGTIRWGDMMKELSLRVRGGKETEKLLKRKQRAKKSN